MRAPLLATKYGFNFGTGVVRGFLSEYYAYGRPPGAGTAIMTPPSPLVAAKTLLRGVGSAAWRTDGRERRHGRWHAGFRKSAS